MSGGDDLLVWVGDLDNYVNIDAINRANQREEEEAALRQELREIGELRLLDGKATSAKDLFNRNIAPSEWRHAVHQAEMTISHENAEERYLKGLLDLGRSYAIARFARWEKLDYPSALTATLPHGIRALVNQLLLAEGIERSRYVEDVIRSALITTDRNGLTAYSRTGQVQSALHRITKRPPYFEGPKKLNRFGMRNILSLTRLHFSVAELKSISIDDLKSLFLDYENERAAAATCDNPIVTNGKSIRGWSQRHIQPLTNLYPFCIRHALKRTTADRQGGLDRAALVNELALAHCGILRMRRAGRDRTRSK